MQAVAYYLLLPVIYLVSLTPFPLLYVLSDLLFVFIYNIVGYRRKVVTENLQRSFPEKSKAEISKLTIRFYHYLCDITLETFKTLTISRSSAVKHCKMSSEAQRLFDKYNDEHISFIIVMGHFGNWEWAGAYSFSLLCKQPLYVIYHPFSNKYFDRFIYNMRGRFGTGLIAMSDTYKKMARKRGEVNATAFIADQTPAPEHAYWTTFLNQDTPVFWGTEKIARKMNYPVVYVSVKRQKRGYYEIDAETLFEDSKNTAEGEISEAHTRKLEEDIRKHPEFWLWSHRRWKHKRPDHIGTQMT